MINIVDKTKCCGCTACYSICPKHAIEMKADFEGFLYPKIDQSLCCDCGLCEKACPVIELPQNNTFDVKSYVLRTKESSILMQSTSGGFITPLANYVLKSEGAVCAATYDDKFRVCHTVISKDKHELSRIRGSKYVQSYLNDCFIEVRNHLKNDKLVCFVGTTCQVAGLKKFLCNDYANLITVDLVCHGTPSPKLWDKYLEYQKHRFNSDISEVSFRNKTYGYHSGTMKIQFNNGKQYFGSGRVDFMLKSFFSEISSRPICYECPFKTLKRCSDFTIYDCWHPEQLVDGLSDDDRGYTNVIVQSAGGLNILEVINDNYEIYPSDTHFAVELDGVMVNKSAKPHPRRSEYYLDFAQNSIKDHVQKYIPISKKDLIVENMKSVVYKMGIYNLIKKIVK